MKDILATHSSEGLSVTLCQDGWSSTSNHPILAHSIFINKNTYFLSSQDCETSKKDSSFCAKYAIEAIEKLKKMNNVDVFAVCTDNEAKMLATRRKIKERFPKILVYGCSSHYLNLVETAVTPNTVLKHIVEIQNFFRNHHQPRGWLIEHNGKKPQLPNQTRWNSQLDCVDTFLHNWMAYNNITREHTDYDFKDIKKKLSDISIYNNANDLKEQLKIVGAALDRMQSDSITLSGKFFFYLNSLFLNSNYITH